MEAVGVRCTKAGIKASWMAELTPMEGRMS
jgi:hypothetical protein